MSTGSPGVVGGRGVLGDDGGSSHDAASNNNDSEKTHALINRWM